MESLYHDVADEAMHDWLMERHAMHDERPTAAELADDDWFDDRDDDWFEEDEGDWQEHIEASERIGYHDEVVQAEVWLAGPRW